MATTKPAVVRTKTRARKPSKGADAFEEILNLFSNYVILLKSKQSISHVVRTPGIWLTFSSTIIAFLAVVIYLVNPKYVLWVLSISLFLYIVGLVIGIRKKKSDYFLYDIKADAEAEKDLLSKLDIYKYESLKYAKSRIIFQGKLVQMELKTITIFQKVLAAIIILLPAINSLD